MKKNKLIDPFGREITYLRLSVTDHCNMACEYCREEDHKTKTPKAEVLSYEEIYRIVRLFSELGIEKVRITGGEPLLRKDIKILVSKISSLSTIKDIPLSTNAELLPRLAKDIYDAGVNRLNISIDSLNEDKFSQLTRGGSLKKVIAGIDKAIEVGFKSIKLNMVVMQDKNSDELEAMIDFAMDRGLEIRFIETMPIGTAGIDATARHHITQEEIYNRVSKHLHGKITPKPSKKTDGPATMFSIDDSNSSFGIIGAVSNKFCSSCNRVRLTSKGVLILCLGQENSLSLKDCMRSGETDDEIKNKILMAISNKPEMHFFDTDTSNINTAQMIEIGG